MASSRLLTKEVAITGNSLYHHGIKGQKWGIRNGPPYPLGDSDNSRRNTSNINKGKAFVEAKESTNVKNLQLGGDYSQVTALIAVSAMAVATIGQSVAANQAEKRKDDKRLEELFANKKLSSTNAPRLSKKMSARESMKVVNPDYPDEGSTMNCTFCSAAMALREKGYDVVAAKSADGWIGKYLYKKAFNADTYNIHVNGNGQNLLNELTAYGEGAYGELGISWKIGGGHSLFWKVENGQAHIYDGQMNKEYTETSMSTKKFMQSIGSRGEICRLDNCEPTEYAFAIVESNKNGRKSG